MSIIPARHANVPVWRTRGRYRKEMKRGYSKKTYHNRSKDETIFSVVKRTMGDEVRSIRTRAQNNEMRLKIISYNAARIASLTYFLLRAFLQSPSPIEETSPHAPIRPPRSNMRAHPGSPQSSSRPFVRGQLKRRGPSNFLPDRQPCNCR